MPMVPERIAEIELREREKPIFSSTLIVSLSEIT
jgi:hypothetical protein